MMIQHSVAAEKSSMSTSKRMSWNWHYTPRDALLAVQHSKPDAVVLRMIENAHHAMSLHDECTGSDRELGTVYSTKGMIYQESGDHIRAVDWLYKATDEREKHPSPTWKAWSTISTVRSPA
jgi:hypothetical protein